ncbi:MAG: hypothetical protein HOG79_15535, partial [Prolixibacteraceae bacterium]|nr:hypothetical protein [Prolixibacteraceae bacterium]
NNTQIEIDELIEKMEQNGPCVEVSPTYLHNLVYGAIDFASELGFNPPKDFYITEYVLDPDFVDDGIDEIEMGWDGKPLYIEGPYDNSQNIFNTLNKSVGQGGYEFIALG